MLLSLKGSFIGKLIILIFNVYIFYKLCPTGRQNDQISENVLNMGPKRQESSHHNKCINKI